MTVELRPLGVHCNIACQYCYQNPQRAAGNLRAQYDLDLMKQAIAEEGREFTLFGGEALLLPEDDLENLWSWGYQKFGGNAVQTNGTLITQSHIEMFRRYNVSVGISIDGPGELNDIRWAGSLAATREATQKTEDAIAALCREGMPPALIVTLHRHNATRDKLPRMKAWFHELEAMGVSQMRLHILEVDDPAVREHCSLSDAENIEAFLYFFRAAKEFKHLQFDVYWSIRALLLGREQEVSCIWRACDPYTTAGVSGVEGHGERSNCGQASKDGIDFIKADSPGFERYLALYHAPQSTGGCRDCRFFLMCKGQCPGNAIDGDWRNHSEHCAVWMAMFEYCEQELIAEGHTPVSLSAQRRLMEQQLLRYWESGRTVTMEILFADCNSQAAG